MYVCVVYIYVYIYRDIYIVRICPIAYVYIYTCICVDVNTRYKRYILRTVETLKWKEGKAGTSPVYTPYLFSRQAAFALVRTRDECSASGGALVEEMLVSSTKAPSPSPHLCLAPSALQKTVVTLAKRKETLRLI